MDATTRSIIQQRRNRIDADIAAWIEHMSGSTGAWTDTDIADIRAVLRRVAEGERGIYGPGAFYPALPEEQPASAPTDKPLTEMNTTELIKVITALEDEIERLTNQLALDITERIRLRRMNVENGTMDLVIESEIVPLIAAMLYRVVANPDEHGVPQRPGNYASMTIGPVAAVNNGPPEKYEIIIQRKAQGTLTPAEKADILDTWARTAQQAINSARRRAEWNDDDDVLDILNTVPRLPTITQQD